MGLPKRLEDTLIFASDYTEDYGGGESSFHHDLDRSHFTDYEWREVPKEIKARKKEYEELVSLGYMWKGFGDEYFLTKKDLSWMKNRDLV